MINSVERDARISTGEVSEVRETPGWERIRVQIDSGAIDTVCPKEIAKAFEMKETATSRKVTRFVAANRSGINDHGEKAIVGQTEDGERNYFEDTVCGCEEGAGVGSQDEFGRQPGCAGR